MYIDDVLELSAPIFCFLELTNVCNNKCPGCGNVFEHGKDKQLSLAGWKLVIEELSKFVFSVKITGGEATLRRDFWEILDLLENKKIIFSVFSNGRWKNPEQFTNKIKSYKYFKGFLISLHGHDAKSHEKWSGVKGSFEETTNNIKLMAQKNIPAQANVVISQYNYDKLEEIIDLSFSLGAIGVAVNRLLHGRENSFKVMASEEQLVTAINTTEKLRKGKYQNYIIYGNCIPHCFYSSAAMGCTTGTTFATIDPFGNLKPCNHAEYVAGNIIKDGLLKCWRSDLMRQWRSFLPDDCKICSGRLNCRGGCRALAFKYGKDPLMKNKLERIKEERRAPEVKINKYIRPRLKVNKTRKEASGYLLLGVSDNDFSIVTEESYDFLNNLDKFTNIEEIHRQKGEDAVRLIYSLYNRGMIIFDNTAEKASHSGVSAAAQEVTVEN